MITPRYSCIFIRRFCPRNCSYCLAKDVRGKGKLLRPEQWRDALRILEDNGVVFHLILGNELFTYPWPVEFVKMLKEFWGRYAIYSTFPEPWASKYLDKCIDVGLYNISGGVDVWPGLQTGDEDVDDKSDSVLRWLVYAKQRGVSDVQATVTIHRRNYLKLEPLFDLLTKHGVWIGLSKVEFSIDGRHDFYGTKEVLKDWIIEDEQVERFRDEMYRLAEIVESGRWRMQVPSEYFRLLGDLEVAQRSWHCSLPVIIHIEEDGSLRVCNYRGPLSEEHSVFELSDGSFTMEDYVRLQKIETSKCPGCGIGGAWSYWWMSEYWFEGNTSLGDQVFQKHLPGYEFERNLRRSEE